MPEQTVSKSTPIVFLTDNDYVIPTAVATQSLIDHWAGAKPLRIYVIVHEVCDDYRERLMRFCSDEVHIELIESDWDSENLSCYYDQGSYVSTTSMLKFCIPRLLPEDDKILYLDGDILIQKDLSPLTEYDVSDYYVAAVEDLAAVKSVKLHDVVGVTRYFNSGILLLNAKRFREEGLEKTMFDIGQEHPEYMCRDQSVFNKGFREQVLWLSPEWNMMIFNLRHANYSMVLINTFYGTEYRDIHEMEQNAALIHLTNKYKPWKFINAYRSKDWFALFRRTPFSSVSLSLRSIEEDLAKTEKIIRQSRHIIKRFGFFIKDWAPEKTTLTAFHVLLAQKTRLPELRETRLLGFPVFQRKFDPEYVTTIVMGVRLSKAENLKAIAERFDHRVSIMVNEKAGACVWADEDPFVYFAIRQLQVLEQLKKRRGKQK